MSRKEDVRRSTWNDNDQSSRRRVKVGMWSHVARKSRRLTLKALCALIYKYTFFSCNTNFEVVKFVVVT